MKAILSLVVLEVVISVIFIQMAAADSITTHLKIGDAFPAKEVSTLPVVAESGAAPAFTGKPTVVVYWASWCPHCRKQTDYIGMLYKKYSSKGFKVLGIDGDKDRAKGAEYAKAHIPFPSVYDEGQHLYRDWGVQGIPVTVIVGGDGKITDLIGGESVYLTNPIGALAQVIAGESGT